MALALPDRMLAEAEVISKRCLAEREKGKSSNPVLAEVAANQDLELNVISYQPFRRWRPADMVLDRPADC